MVITIHFIKVWLVLDHQKHPINLMVELFIIVIEGLKQTKSFIEVVNWLDLHLKIIIGTIITKFAIVVINVIIMQLVIVVGSDHLQNLIN